MNIFPTEIENIINEYKYQLEHVENMKSVFKQINNIDYSIDIFGGESLSTRSVKMITNITDESLKYIAVEYHCTTQDLQIERRMIFKTDHSYSCTYTHVICNTIEGVFFDDIDMSYNEI